MNSESLWGAIEGFSLYDHGVKISEQYKTIDKFGNKVIVRYNWDHIKKVLAAKENVRRYCHG